MEEQNSANKQIEIKRTRLRTRLKKESLNMDDKALSSSFHILRDPTSTKFLFQCIDYTGTTGLVNLLSLQAVASTDSDLSINVSS